MPKEENARETVTEETPLDEVPVTDAEVLAALGLNANLEPISESTGKAEGRGAGAAGKAQAKPQARTSPAGGANASAVEDQLEEEDLEGQGEELLRDQEDEEPPEEEPEQEEEEQEPEEQAEPLRAPPKGISEMQRRIDKLTAKNKGLEASLAKASRLMLQPTESDPLADLNSEGDVRGYMDFMRKKKRWCLENLDGGEDVDDKGNPIELSAKEVRARYAYADEVVQEHGPRRLSYLQERAKFDVMARGEYPALFDDESMDARMMANFIALCPEMLRVPNYQMIIGDAIRGMRSRIAKAQGQAGQTAKRTTQGGLVTAMPGNNVRLAPKAIRGGAATQTRVKSGLGAATRLHREFLETGDKRKLTAMIESTL